MARLVDHILYHQDIRFPEWADQEKVSEQEGFSIYRPSHFRKVPIIDGSALVSKDGSYKNPNLMSISIPFPDCFLEWKTRDGDYLGVFLRTRDAKGLKVNSVPPTRWQSAGRLMVNFAKPAGIAVWDIGSCLLSIDDNGRLVPRASGVWVHPAKPNLNPAGYKDVGIYLRDAMLFLCYALAFISCSNIGLRKIDPPEKVQKKRRRNGKLPLVSYHVAEIKPHTTSPSKFNGIPLNHNRVHLCRGHFATYTEEKPLFGKHIGTYWVPAHVRGRNKKGIVLKDYAATSGKAEKGAAL